MDMRVGADQFEVDKAGHLLKQYGRTFPYLTSHWRRRFCVLANGHLYIYEKDTRQDGDKTTLVIDLTNVSSVQEETRKETKRLPHVFTVTSAQMSHSFAAESLPEMQDWLSKIRSAIECSKNNNKLNKKTNVRDTKEGMQPRDKTKSINEGIAVEAANWHERIQSADLQDRESRKISISTDYQISENCGVSDELETIKATNSQLAPDSSLQKTPKHSTQMEDAQPELNVKINQLPLDCVTKHRNRGPSGRRAPQKRPSFLMKQRANSMSELLELKNLEKGDVRSGEIPGIINRFSASSSSECVDMNIRFDENVESALFFSRSRSIYDKQESQNEQLKFDDQPKRFRFTKLRFAKSKNSAKQKLVSLFGPRKLKFVSKESLNSRDCAVRLDDSCYSQRICSLL